MSGEFVFVLSLGRSGSTFILNIFDQLPDQFLCYPNEWSFISRYSQILDDQKKAPLSKFISLYKTDTKSVDNVCIKLEKLETDVRVSIFEFIEQVAIACGCMPQQKFVIKTTDLQDIWLYYDLFPASKFILNIRKPLDFIHSFNTHWFKYDYPMYPGHWETPVHVNGALAVHACIRAAWYFRANARCCVVRLEDLEASNLKFAVNGAVKMLEFCDTDFADVGFLKQILQSQKGRNSSAQLIGKRKTQKFKNLGLVQSERVALSKCEVFIEYFYPGHYQEILDAPRENLFIRFLKYEKLKMKINEHFSILNFCRRVGTYFREVFGR
jgi:hypothetical protein